MASLEVIQDHLACFPFLFLAEVPRGGFRNPSPPQAPLDPPCKNQSVANVRRLFTIVSYKFLS
jgi:hypothetical protein